MSDVFEHAVCPISGLDRKHVSGSQDDSLTDIESTDRSNQCQAALDIGCVARRRPVNTQRSLPHQNVGGEFVRRHEPKLMSLEQTRQTGQQVVIAAPEKVNDFGEQQHSQPVESDVAKRWTYDIADENDIPATF